MDWEALKRVPQMVKRKVKLGTNTFDEEFNLYFEDLTRLDKRLEALMKYCKVSTQETKTALKGLELIGLAFRDLYDPLNGLPVEVKERLKNNVPTDQLFGSDSNSKRIQFEREYLNWENSKLFIDGVKDIVPAVEIELDQLVELMVKKTLQLQKIVNNIKTRCKLREASLYDYDIVFNEYEDLVIRLKTAPLSVKDSSKMFRLERKTEELRLVYQERNHSLKSELPHFFKLVDMIFKPLLEIFYYVHLTVTYQIHNNMNSLSDIFQITMDDLDFNQIITCYERDTQTVQQSLNNLGIINFTENYLADLTSSVPSYKEIQPPDNNNYCQAIYNFNGVLAGDLKFKTNDMIKILNQSGSWWEGELNGEKGSFPSNYVKLLPTKSS
ncbi:uncharacterized protein KQ657_000417 [Scheffersomyces spartinae]|uniref:SH3 domain-containing protein n=1 Tax=Scheffersomyces spartinae TaxID=45513 RepID=A0A9P8AJ20_9ASCO|nr:uncharacterized protein KQ657_000417 [Scheffersomyces spartinae]KAG7193726.1 hypothetical protein KQ657_000417 [Scheffersomyces spartinae]